MGCLLAVEGLEDGNFESRDECGSNSRSLPHLSSLTLQATNALLSPLSSHLEVTAAGVSNDVTDEVGANSAICAREQLVN